jgi:hypothetical protein
MGLFENPDLRAPAARTVCLNHFASIEALRKKDCFDQPKSYLAPRPRFLVYTTAVCGAADIFFKQALRGLYAFLLARVAYDFARAASVTQHPLRFRFAGLWSGESWVRIARLLYRAIAGRCSIAKHRGEP